MHLRNKIKKIILENAVLFFIYRTTILKIKRSRIERSNAFLTGNGKMTLPSIKEILDKINRKDLNLNQNTVRDIIDCFLLYGFDAKEYVLFQLYKKNYKQRLEYLSDQYMDCLNILCLGSDWGNIYAELKDKNKFYELTKTFFKRDVLKISSQTTLNELEDFVGKHSSFIVKPLQGAMGRGVHMISEKDYSNIQDILDHYVGDGYSEWILEELIEQASEMSAWNHSSVNTIRICSFRKGDDFIVCWPRIRTGRKGMVVDNAGQGGVLASIDVKTGVVCTNGADEYGNFFEKHPDSGITFLGWQVPLWNDLIQLCKDVHRSLSSRHKYIAFDFALTPNGWALIEGNWGQFMGSQITLGKGLRKDYEKLMQN